MQVEPQLTPRPCAQSTLRSLSTLAFNACCQCLLSALAVSACFERSLCALALSACFQSLLLALEAITWPSAINPRPYVSYDDHFAAVNAVKFHPDGTCIASGGADNVVQLWDVRSKKLVQHYQVRQIMMMWLMIMTW